MRTCYGLPVRTGQDARAPSGQDESGPDDIARCDGRRPARAPFLDRAVVAGRGTRVRGSRLPLHEQPAEPRHHLAGARRGRPALPVGSGYRRGAVVEIGRFKGGSTLLLAAALGGRAELWSYDIHASHQATYTGADLDEELRDALRRLSLEERVHLVVGDSRLVPPPEGPIELLFVDGDHSYEGVSADWSHWGPSLAIGGQRCSTTRSTTAASGPTSKAWGASWPSSIATRRSSAGRMPVASPTSSGRAERLIVGTRDEIGRRLPRVTQRPLPPGEREAGGERLVFEDARERRCDVVHVGRVDEQSCSALRELLGRGPRDVTTGVPCAIASTTGNPNPSSRLGKQNTPAPAYRAARSSRGTHPSRLTRACTPSGRAPRLDSRSSFQPRGPTRTRSTRGLREAKARSSVGRFFRGSTVPVHRT